MEIDRRAQTPIVAALQQNRGELDAESLRRLLASLSEAPSAGASTARTTADDPSSES